MFFSVIKPIRIGGRIYRPCICYEIASYLRSTVEKLEKEGTVKVYSEKVYFCNGKIVPKQEAIKENVTTEKTKKNKKEKTVPVKDVKELAEVAEIVPSPEEIADNIEDF